LPKGRRSPSSVRYNLFKAKSIIRSLFDEKTEYAEKSWH
jgi:hypothetical protein